MLATTLFVVIFSPALYQYNMLFVDAAAAAPRFVYVVLLVIGLSVVAVVAISVLERVIHQKNASPDISEIAQPRLASRLPALNGAKVSRLTVDDHYVKVFLSDGRQARLLMRLADAIGEMDQSAGITTHRSHWVAQDFVVGLVKEGRREFVELSCGTRVPVSRSYRSSVIEAGVKALA